MDVLEGVAVAVVVVVVVLVVGARGVAAGVAIIQVPCTTRSIECWTWTLKWEEID